MSGTTSQACACGTCASCTAAAGREPDRAFMLRHSALRARMLESIAGVEIDVTRPLAALGTRTLDDPGIALIDAHAACLHVLAWNCGRLEDDATIGRTEDRDALVALSRLLGYEPRPALSATTTIAFTLDDFIGSPGQATIPRRTKIASMPKQDELPQTFETDVAIEARASWNAIAPVQAYAPYAVASGASSLVIQGTQIAVRPGDHLLFDIDGKCRLAIVTAFERIPEAGRERTRIDYGVVRDLSRDGAVTSPGVGTVVVLGQRTAPFGATAPDARLMPIDSAATKTATEDVGGGIREWKDFVVGVPGDTKHNRVDLDAVNTDAVAGRYTVFTGPFTAHVGTITDSEELSRADFGMTAKITRITTAGIPLKTSDDIVLKPHKTGIDLIEAEIGGSIFVFDTFGPYVRETAIYIETGRAELFHFIVDAAMPADPQSLDVVGTVALPAGRKVLLAGEAWAGTAGARGAALVELAEILKTEAIGAKTRLHFKRPVAGKFRSSTLMLNGNCAPASHGETIANGPEIVGSGSGNTALPRFTLSRAPLAYVPAENARGYAPALELRVNDRLCGEVPTLHGQPEGARTYTVRQVAGKSEVQFASRLPGGTYNVAATYRTGGGTAGLIEAGRITSILSPVLGVKSAINPVAATGGSDAVVIEDLRWAAPRYVQTLDRVVSLADYEAFARDFRGVGKAMATEVHDGMRALVVLTLADTSMAPPAAESDIVTGLATSLADAAVPGRKVRVRGFVDYLAVLEVALATDSTLPRDTVEAAVRAALAARFGRPARQFGQGLHTSELLATVQEVSGVRAALIKGWQRALAKPFTLESAGVGAARLLCPAAGFEQLAGLLSVDPAHVTFSELPA